jgi:hypothetical protein
VLVHLGIGRAQDLSQQNTNFHYSSHSWFVYLPPLKPNAHMYQEVKSVFLVIF